MTYIGELISIGVAFSWTATALLSEFGSKRLGNLTLNVLRMALALVFSLVLFMVVSGSPMPAGATPEAMGWMLLSGLVGYVIGDFCLFQCYIIIGSRYGQLFMTLAPLSAALMAWITLGQQLSGSALLAMFITLLGIGISVLGRGEHHKVSLKLPLNGVLFAIGAAMCQGIGLVLSKIGMEHYGLAVPDGAPATMEAMLPFASTMIRAIIGAIGFIILLSVTKGLGSLKPAVKDPKGMKYTALLTFFGPALGVSLSLMAVRYANAGIASTLMALAPVIIIAPDVLINKHKIKLKEIIGVLVSITGVAMFFLL